MTSKQSRTNRAASGVLLSVAWLPLALTRAPAYIDLGTGSLIIQVIIASTVGGLFLLKGFWRKVKTFLVSLVSRTKGSGD